MKDDVNRLLNAALGYAAQRHWPVFPCKPEDKSPYTKNGFKDATTDEQQIRKWWTEYPKAMIGVPMGKASGIFALDLDVKKGKRGLEAWAEFLREHDTPEPITRVQQTPSGGRHYLFAWQTGISSIPELGNENDGLEIKGDGGYIIMAPSVMADESSYSTISDVDIAEPPLCLLVEIDVYFQPSYQESTHDREPPDEEEIKAALDAVSSDLPYLLWIRVGASIYNTIGERGRKLFEDWSRKGKKFNPKKDYKKYSEVQDLKRITIGTLFRLAYLEDPSWRERYKQRQRIDYGPGSAEDGGHHARQGDDWELVSVPISSIPAKKIVWLWKWRIACGKLNVFAGMPDTNKSTIALDIAARVSVGGPLPAGEGVAPLGNVIILSAEDDPADTLRPRLEVAGADLNRIHYVSMVKQKDGKGQRGFDLTQDIARLERKIIEIGNVVLVIIDPVSAYLGKPGKLDSYRQTDVRATLAPLEALAARLGVAFIGIEHLNKSSGLKALLRVAGSIAFAAAPRALIIIARDEEDDKDRRLFLPAKNNVAPEEYKTGLACRIGRKLAPPPVFEVMPVCEWENEPVSMTADEALEQDGKKPDGRKSETVEAWKIFLEEFLRAGPRMVKEIEDEALKRGLAPGSKAMRNAKEKLKIVSTRKGTAGWEWTLPGQQAAMVL
jgi:hypothetical protein